MLYCAERYNILITIGNDISLKKHSYELSLNSGHKVRNPIVSSFGQNYNIILHVSKDGILIVVYTSAGKTANDILYGNDLLFADAVRKALLIYTIRYNKYILIRYAEVKIDSEMQASYNAKGNNPLVYSLNDGKLRLSFGDLWVKSDIESAIAKTSKYAYDGR